MKIRKRRLSVFTVFILLCVIAGLCYGRWQSNEPALSLFETETTETEQEWNLLLVNENNRIPDNYRIESLTTLSNGQRVDSRIYPALQEMFDDARNEGIYPIVRDGYRSGDEQQQILYNRIEAYIEEGFSKAEAKKAAENWVALPGTSEHELGLAVDINADKDKCTNEAVYEWLAVNAYEYGFILRYPQEKESITGTSYEPWHYRYVGEKAAKEIYERGVCLEEYLGMNM